MKRTIVFITVVFISSFFFNHASAQAAYQLIQSDGIKVKSHQPTNFNTGRNIVNNKSKRRKVKVKVKYTYGLSCSGHIAYFSKARAKRQKKMNRRRG